MNTLENNTVTHTAEITSDCTCKTCPACSKDENLYSPIFYTLDECDECGAELEYTGDCFGCYDDSKESAAYIVDLWLKTQDESVSHVVINGERMGWRSLNGWKIARADFDSIYSALMINGEFRIVFDLDGYRNLKITRSSHDEPMGARFTLQALDLRCRECGDDSDPETVLDNLMNNLAPRCSYC